MSPEGEAPACGRCGMRCGRFIRSERDAQGKWLQREGWRCLDCPPPRGEDEQRSPCTWGN